jgi:hypothetical protein
VQLSAGTRSQPDGDVLLTIAEASTRLSVSTDTLYRNEFAFTRHVGRRRLFSRNGIEKAIQQNDLTPGPIDANLTHPKNRKRLNYGYLQVAVKIGATRGWTQIRESYNVQASQKSRIKTRGDGRIFARADTANLWCAYFLRGKEYCESTGTSDLQAAEKFLKVASKR